MFCTSTMYFRHSSSHKHYFFFLFKIVQDSIKEKLRILRVNASCSRNHFFHYCSLAVMFNVMKVCFQTLCCLCASFLRCSRLVESLYFSLLGPMSFKNVSVAFKFEHPNFCPSVIVKWSINSQFDVCSSSNVYATIYKNSWYLSSTL